MKNVTSILFLLIIVSESCFGQTNTNKDTINSIKTEADTTVYSKTEEIPQFKGGEMALMKFLQHNMRPPKSAADKGISGTCITSFVVEKDGSITNIKTIKGISGSVECEIEARRVISLMPPMIPGKINGKPVRSLFQVPIKFTF